MKVTNKERMKSIDIALWGIMFAINWKVGIIFLVIAVISFKDKTELYKK